MPWSTKTVLSFLLDYSIRSSLSAMYFLLFFFFFFFFGFFFLVFFFFLLFFFFVFFLDFFLYFLYFTLVHLQIFVRTVFIVNNWHITSNREPCPVGKDRDDFLSPDV